MSGADLAITITRFRTVDTSKGGKREATTWGALRAWLATPPPRVPLALLRRDDKDPTKWKKPADLGGFALATFADDHRKKVNVERVHGLALDFDDDPIAVTDAVSAWRDLFGAVVSTFNATSQRPRHRVYLALSRAVTADEYAALWPLVAERAPTKPDATTRDASRFWYDPALPEDAPHDFAPLDGAPLDVDALLASGGTRYGSRALAGEVQRVRRARSGERNATLNRAAFAVGQLAASGDVPPDAARAQLAEAATAAGLDPDEIEKTIASGVNAGLANPRERLPVVQLVHDLRAVVNAAADLLPRDLDVYQRDGLLVRVVRIAESEADALALEGAPQIRPVRDVTLLERLSNLAEWQRLDGRSRRWERTAPPMFVANALAERGEWPGVRPITAVIESPTMRPDGSIVDRAGYDAATGYVLMPSADFPPVPAEPTQADARRALADLSEPFAEFPWVDDAARAAVVSAVLTVVARPAIAGSVPGFIVDASTRAAGKTLAADVISQTATGRPTARLNYPGDAAELEKILAACALRAMPIIAFDNIVTGFGGGPLDRCITATDAVQLRVLGRTEAPSLKWRSVILGTGNNVAVLGDTSRRVLTARLVPSEERPEDRTGFRISDLREWVNAHRARLVVAALTVLRAYVTAGRPNVGTKTWGSFEPWAALIPPAIVFAGGADPMQARTVEDAHDPERAALLAIVADWPRLDVDGTGVSAKRAIDALYPADRLRGECAPDGFEAIREAIEGVVPTRPGQRPEAIKLAGFLRSHRDRVVAGRRITSTTDRKGFTLWRVTA